jgi:hypothetical protein
MAILKHKFWGIFSAFVAVGATFLGLSSAKNAAGRTIEMRLADVRKHVKLLEKDQVRDIGWALYPQSDETSASDTRVSQKWDNWRDYRWKDRPRWDDWRDYRWRKY